LDTSFYRLRRASWKAGQKYKSETAAREMAMVVLGGVCSVTSSRGEWRGIGQRETVFDGLPYTLYLPIGTSFTVSADAACDLAFCYCKADEEYPARLVTPAHVSIEIRGGGNATRQINSMLPPRFLRRG
jgi:5-deoxy-glucuronate isomerase